MEVDLIFRIAAIGIIVSVLYQVLLRSGREEQAMLDGGKCILQLRGVRPFLSDKYDLTQHPNYKLTSDYYLIIKTHRKGD